MPSYPLSPAGLSLRLLAMDAIRFPSGSASVWSYTRSLLSLHRSSPAFLASSGREHLSRNCMHLIYYRVATQLFQYRALLSALLSHKSTYTFAHVGKPRIQPCSWALRLSGRIAHVELSFASPLRVVTKWRIVAQSAVWRPAWSFWVWPNYNLLHFARSRPDWGHYCSTADKVQIPDRKSP